MCCTVWVLKRLSLQIQRRHWSWIVGLFYWNMSLHQRGLLFISNKWLLRFWILLVVGNGCKLLDLHKVVLGFLGNGFDLQLAYFQEYVCQVTCFFSPPHKRDCCCKEINHFKNLFLVSACLFLIIIVNSYNASKPVIPSLIIEATTLFLENSNTTILTADSCQNQCDFNSKSICLMQYLLQLHMIVYSFSNPHYDHWSKYH